MGKWFIKASVCYDMGSIRKNNEDAYYFNGHFSPLSKMNNNILLTVETKAAGSLWAVCDGMGGQRNGERASFTAVSSMPDLQKSLRGQEFETIVQSWVFQVNRAVAEQAEGGGSTLAMLYCTDQYIQTAHIGDSRIYRYHDDQLIRMTKDHSKVEMLMDAKMITREEAKNHPQKNIVTRYLGMDSEYVCTAAIGNKIPYCNGDRYLICSDGITEMLAEETIAAYLAENDQVAACAKKMRDAVLSAGAKDNLTAIILDVEAEDQMDFASGETTIQLTGDEPTV